MASRDEGFGMLPFQDDSFVFLSFPKGAEQQPVPAFTFKGQFWDETEKIRFKKVWERLLSEQKTYCWT